MNRKLHKILEFVLIQSLVAAFMLTTVIDFAHAYRSNRVKIEIEAPTKDKTTQMKKGQRFTFWKKGWVRGGYWSGASAKRWYHETIKTVRIINEQIQLLEYLQDYMHRMAVIMAVIPKAGTPSMEWNRRSITRLFKRILKGHPEYSSERSLVSTMEIDAKSILDRAKKGALEFFYVRNESFEKLQKVSPQLAASEEDSSYVVYVLSDCYTQGDMETLMNAQVSAAKRALEAVKKYKNLKEKLLKKQEKGK